MLLKSVFGFSLEESGLIGALWALPPWQRASYSLTGWAAFIGFLVLGAGCWVGPALHLGSAPEAAEVMAAVPSAAVLNVAAGVF